MIALSGELGAGKTVFVKGLAEGLGIDPAQVSSPSYVIARQHDARGGRRLNHVDLYRLESAAELETAGLYDLLEPGAVTAVEWGNRFGGALAPDRLEVELARERLAGSPEPSTSDVRHLAAVATGPEARRVLERWRTAIRGDRSGDSS